MNSVGLILLLLALILILLILEYLDHDCINGKACYQSQPMPDGTESAEEQIQQAQAAVAATNNAIIWRQSLLVALILVVPISYILLHRVCTPLECLIIVALIFTVVYFVRSWMWSHFYEPNSQRIEKGLDMLLRIRADVE